VRRLRPLGIFPVLLFIIAAGCSVEEPKAPSFITNINVPTGTHVYTIKELIRTNDVVQGDTTGHNPVRISWEGQVDEIQVGDRLKASFPQKSFSGSIDDVDIENPTPVDYTFGILDVAPPAIQAMIPSQPQTIPGLPRFDFEPAVGNIPEIDNFEEGTLSSGTLSLTVANHLPVAIDSVWVELTNTTGGETIALLRFDSPINPETTAMTSIDLGGVMITNHLSAHFIRGISRPSNGPVEVYSGNSIQLTAQLSNMAFDQVRAPVGHLSANAADTATLGSDIIVQEALISGSGVIPMVITKTLPLPIRITIHLPEIERQEGGVWVPWTGVFRLSLLQQQITTGIDLSGARLVPADDGSGNQILHYTFEMESDGSNGSVLTLNHTMGASVTVGSNPATELHFQAVTAAFRPVDSTVDPIHTTFDLPEGTEGLTFSNAALVLEVTNELQIPGELNLTVVGTSGNGTQSLPLTGHVKAAGPTGPRVTRLSWNAASLVNIHPDDIEVSGTVTVGNIDSVGTVHPLDALNARYEIDAPLLVTIQETTVRPDSFTFEMDQDIRDQLKEDVLRGEAVVVVDSHLPVGASVTLQFADNAANLRLPDGAHHMSLNTVSVEAADTDPITHQVNSVKSSNVSISLDQEQIQFFAPLPEVYCQAVIRLDSSGSNPVQLMTDDYMQVSGVLRFRLKVEEDK
jgi:hypothetical protein